MIALPCLKAQSNFLLGISGEEVLLSQHGKSADASGNNLLMETSGTEQMDVTMSGRLQHRFQYDSQTPDRTKKQAFPMISKRPETCV